MKFPIEFFCNPIDNDYQLLSIYNMPLSKFLSVLKPVAIEEIKVYWLSKEKSFISSSDVSRPLFDITTCLIDTNVSISSIEITLSNGFLIDSNVKDEIFCRMPIACDIQTLVEQIINLSEKYHLPAAPYIKWNTVEIE